MTTHNTSPRSCREYIEQAAMEEPMARNAIDLMRYHGYTWEQTLECLVVSLLENKKHLTDQFMKYYQLDNFHKIVCKEAFESMPIPLNKNDE